MQSALEVYEAQLRLVTDTCADPWFSEQLALARAADADAHRRICGSCLRLVLDLARERWSPDGPLDLLELVQEGNAILMKTLKRFAGSTAREFLGQLRRAVESWFTVLFEHPAWARQRWDLPPPPGSLSPPAS
jgi:hypothetical protein